MINDKRVFSNGEDFQANIGDYTMKIVEHVLELDKHNVIDRMWKNDHTVWSTEPEEVSNRLGWLKCPDVMKEAVFEIKSHVDEIRKSNLNTTVLLGMGGSSLAAEVFRSVFGVNVGFLDLIVLDSTDPGAVLGVEKTLDLKNTLFVVSTKSGSTVETISLMKYFYHLAYIKLGKKEAGDHFIAIWSRRTRTGRRSRRRTAARAWRCPDGPLSGSPQGVPSAPPSVSRRPPAPCARPSASSWRP